GDALAAMETQLNGPIVADNDGDHTSHNQVRRASEIQSEPDRQRAFQAIEQQSDGKAGWPNNTTDISRAKSAASLKAQIQASAPAHPVITDGAAADTITNGQEQPFPAREHVEMWHSGHLGFPHGTRSIAVDCRR